MALEKLQCPCCNTTYSIEWNEDETLNYVEPDYCPMCGHELAETLYYEAEYDDE
jgi:Zn ribbon nucleic-acid-binding protein